MRIKTLALAVALAAAGTTAHAAISPGYVNTDGELFLTVFSPTLQASYNLDLGIYSAAFNTSNSFTSVNLAADADFASFIGQTDLRYTVTGASYDLASDPDYVNWGLYTTTTNTGAHLTSDSVMRGYSDAELVMGRIGDMAGRINGNAVSTGQPDSNPALFNINNSSVALQGQQGYYNDALWGDNLGGSGFTTSTAAGTSINFYHVGYDLQAAINQGVDQNLAFLLGQWTLGTNGVLSYTAANAVPVPAAAWLFGSGLLGLVGVARRKAA